MSTTVSYKGQTIATVDNATKVLQTQGKYCEDNITLVDVSGGGSPNLQTKSKTYTPTGSQQIDTITADAGYDGLDEVNITVNAGYSTTNHNGSIISFSSDDVVKQLIVDINFAQPGSGDTLPSNIRPITAWSGANITRVGKNLLSFTGTSQTKNGVTWSVDSSGAVTANGTATSNSQFNYYEKAQMPQLESGKQYILSGCPDGGSTNNYYLRLLQYDSNGTLINNSSYIATDTGSGATFTVASNMDTALVFCIVLNGISAPSAKWYPMVRLASETDVATKTVTWMEAGTVGEGTLDLLTGVLTVTKKYVKYTGASSESWSYMANASANTDRVIIALSGAKSGVGNYLVDTNYLKKVASQATSWSAYVNNNGVLLVFLPKGQFANAAAWKTYLASNNLQVVYPVSTPLTYQLTKPQISILLGENTMWVDCGNLRSEHETIQQ